ncbi:MAG TPA: Txe/YoeB family addiction module toxin [Spirochaetota bacterium]|nr:Txe/YoeB family addiction module toxin [Spirochaetota bacterium]
MKLDFEKSAFEDFQYWVKNDKKKALKILQLIDDIQKEPFNGLGKPEPLRFNLSDCWSRRIDLEHRLVYKIENDTIKIFSCRYHY